MFGSLLSSNRGAGDTLWMIGGDGSLNQEKGNGKRETGKRFAVSADPSSDAVGDQG